MLNDLPIFPLDHLPLFGAADAPALIIRDQGFDYKALNLRIGRLAAWLASRGYASGDRVATWLGKGEVSCLMPLAAVRAGLVHVPVNPLLKAGQVAHIMGDSGARLLITNAGRAGTLDGKGEGAQDERSAGFYIVDEKEVLHILDDEAASALDPLPINTDSNTLAAILYTSGSTGRPKGVMLSHANLALGAVSVAQYLKLAADDVTLAVLPLSFDYGQNQLLSTWRAGGCVIPLDYLTPRDVIKACTRHNVTTLAAVPPLWVQLVEQDWPEQTSASMRRLTNSGGALTPTLVRQLRSIFGAGTDIYAMYGLTEAFRSTYLDPALIDGHPTSMGKGIPFAEIMVVAKDGSEAKPGEPGELVHAGPLVAKGYWQDAQRTAERFKPAPSFSQYGGLSVWSGDTVKRDADGLLYFVGRDDAMIKTSGNRVSPTEIEEAAVESGLVAEACALGRKDERLGEAIILFARGTDSVTDGDADEALKAHLKTTLPNFMQPQEIIWLRQFPKNANGKLDRNLLKEQASVRVELSRAHTTSAIGGVMTEREETKAKATIWSRAREMALKAPPERNRYVDFLRAFSILAVVVGHWLVAAPYIKDGVVQGGHLLGILPWTVWLTWGFQVMPIFFLVGGFSNGVSWAANRRNGGTYSGWYSGRLQRLINPVLPLFLIWTSFALFGNAMGVDRKIVALAAELALIPVWFLSVYLMVAAVVPFTHAAWKRFGIGSFWALVAGAVAVDVATLVFHVPYVNFTNFAFVWLAVHQLGFAWNEGYFARPSKTFLWGVGGLIALGLLVRFGPYPVAMIGIPGEPLSNSMPPTLALLALGIAQTGFALALEPWGRRMLDNISIWTSVVLVNGMIMTIYLWHLTAFVLVMVVAWLLGIGLDVAPGSTAWWLARPIWFALYIAALFPLIMAFARYERSSGKAGEEVPHWRLIVGLLLICTGLAATAAISIASPLGVTGVRLWVVALPFIGAAVARFGPAHKLAEQLN